MANPPAVRSTFAASPEEHAALGRLNELLQQSRGGAARLVVDGRQAEVPPAALRLFATSVQALAEHHAVALLPTQRLLTTQAAADVLNVSRPYLVRLLDQGVIPHTKTGTHRRVRLGDVLTYKERRDAQRRQHVRELSRLGQELDTKMSQAAG